MSRSCSLPSVGAGLDYERSPQPTTFPQNPPKMEAGDININQPTTDTAEIPAPQQLIIPNKNQLTTGDEPIIIYVEVFKFDIKVRVVDAAVVTSRQPSRRAIAWEPNQPRYRLLIVDDKWDNRQLLLRLLWAFGFELKEASNGKDAIAIWQEYSPPLIFMDMRMPVMDGYEATKQIKATTKGQATAIIALTASSLEQERAVVLSTGCDDFIRKPFKEAAIFDALYKHKGVRFIYDEPATIPTSTETEAGVLTEAAFAALPHDLVANLHQAIIGLDTELIQVIIAQIRELNEPLAEAIASLAHNFRSKQLLSLTQPKGNSQWESL